MPLSEASAAPGKHANKPAATLGATRSFRCERTASSASGTVTSGGTSATKGGGEAIDSAEDSAVPSAENSAVPSAEDRPRADVLTLSGASSCGGAAYAGEAYELLLYEDAVGGGDWLVSPAEGPNSMEDVAEEAEEVAEEVAEVEKAEEVAEVVEVAEVSQLAEAAQVAEVAEESPRAGCRRRRGEQLLHPH